MSDIIDVAQKLVNTATETLLRTASFTPEDKLNWTPGGAARGTLPMVVECGGIYGMFASLLQGQPMHLEEDDAAFMAQYKNMDSARAMVQENLGKLIEAMGQVKPESPDKELTMPWGAKMTLAEALFFPAQHTQYHIGQINYIQTVLGDTQMH
ncbi:MAG: DinB family protein [Armatimonadetes bacterium]|nr:DinB family protein [Armatimonadota bacterium]